MRPVPWEATVTVDEPTMRPIFSMVEVFGNSENFLLSNWNAVFSAGADGVSTAAQQEVSATVAARIAANGLVAFINGIKGGLLFGGTTPFHAA